MKRNRFTDEQIVAALRDAEATTVVEAARKHGVAEQTMYRWRKRFVDMEVSDVRELKRFKDENARLKKLLAERDLEVEVMKESRQKSGEPVSTTGDGTICNCSRPKPSTLCLVVFNATIRHWLPVKTVAPGSAPVVSTEDCGT